MMATLTPMTDAKQKQTRNAILNALKMDGPQTATMLADQRNLTPMAVRLHLYALEEEGLVAANSRAEGRGRPKKFWTLTDAAARIFPDAHQGLAVEMIDSVRGLFGEDGLNRVIDKHSEVQKQKYKQALESLSALKDKAVRLAELRTTEGYMAEAKPDGNDWLLIENHCPICSAADQCRRLCANELSVFKHALGERVSITREDHILSGARRCTYRISPI